ncbi:MAG TPA: Spy/CpxP family protein refolding chaperone [Candidatus Latescibacteria bacterium]|nr:Spy/CpxP family protein refolding chaperone [Candidatus Latescibacterota bacterium]
MIKMNSRMFIRVMAVLFLAAVLTAAFIMAQDGQAPTPDRKNPPARLNLREALGLSPEQEKALETFRKARMDENKMFREEMTKLRGEMQELAKDPKAGEAKINALIDKTAQLRAERAKAAFKHRGEMEKIFTPEQLKKMQAFRARTMDRMGMAGRGRMGFGRMGFRGPGMGGFMGRGLGMRRMGRFGAFPRRPFPGRRWRW